jgi:hypothetical protein
MAKPIIYCDKCGTTFSPRIEIGTGGAITFVGTKMQCPTCRNWVVVNARWQMTVDGLVSYALASEDPAGFIRSLVDDLNSRADKTPVSQLETDPKWKPIYEYIKDLRLGEVLALLVAVLQLITGGGDDHSVQIGPTTINNYYSSPSKEPKDTTTPTIAKSFADTVLPYNHKCPCKSKKRWGECHGIGKVKPPLPK